MSIPAFKPLCFRSLVPNQKTKVVDLTGGHDINKNPLTNNKDYWDIFATANTPTENNETAMPTISLFFGHNSKITVCADAVEATKQVNDMILTAKQNQAQLEKKPYPLCLPDPTSPVPQPKPRFLSDPKRVA